MPMNIRLKEIIEETFPRGSAVNPESTQSSSKIGQITPRSLEVTNIFLRESLNGFFDKISGSENLIKIKVRSDSGGSNNAFKNKIKTEKSCIKGNRRLSYKGTFYVLLYTCM